MNHGRIFWCHLFFNHRGVIIVLFPFPSLFIYLLIYLYI